MIEGEEGARFSPLAPAEHASARGSAWEKNRREEPATLLPAPERVVAVLTCGRGVGAAAFGYHH